MGNANPKEDEAAAETARTATTTTATTNGNAMDNATDYSITSSSLLHPIPSSLLQEPMGPPPAAPPPPPPPSPSVSQSKNNNDQKKKKNQQQQSDTSSSSYQKQQQSQQKQQQQSQQQSQSQQQGTTTKPSWLISTYTTDIHPNRRVGGRNTEEGRGETLLVVLGRIRLWTLVGCTLAILSESLGFVWKLFQPAKMVLGIYLMVFSLLLLVLTAGTSIGNSSSSSSGSSSGSESSILIPPRLQNWMLEQFGFLHHPLGRVVFLFLMGGLSSGQSGGGLLSMELVLGGLFVFLSGYTLWVYITYPEYRNENHYQTSSSLSNSSVNKDKENQQKEQQHRWANVHPDALRQYAASFRLSHISNIVGGGVGHNNNNNNTNNNNTTAAANEQSSLLGRYAT